MPANEEKKIRKSVSLNADSIVFDLEDAVPDSAKSEARATLRSVINELDWGHRELCIRVNKVGKDYSREDLGFAKGLSKITVIMLPKIEHDPSGIAEGDRKRDQCPNRNGTRNDKLGEYCFGERRLPH